MALPDRPVRFLQANTFYPQYLEDFYTGNPQLIDASYQNQMDALLDDGFSGSHIFTRQLLDHGFETFQVIVNNLVSQAKWSIEAGGTVDGAVDPIQVLQHQIKAFEPDILYLTDIVTFDSRFIRTLSKKPTIVSGWRGFPSPKGTDWSEFDLVLTSFADLHSWSVNNKSDFWSSIWDYFEIIGSILKVELFEVDPIHKKNSSQIKFTPRNKVKKSKSLHN